MKRLLYILATLSFVAFMMGCVKEEVGDVGKETDGNDITFTLTNSADSYAEVKGTRAIGVIPVETVIEKLDVFFYNADGSVCLFYPDASKLVIDRPTGKVTIKISSTIAETLFGNTVQIYVVVNSNLTHAQMAGFTLSQLKNLTMQNAIGFNTETSTDTQIKQTSFLMDGMVEDASTGTSIVISYDKTNLGKVMLRRAAAKIVVDIAKAKVDNYTPTATRVRLANYLDKTAIGVEATNFAASDYKTATVALTNIGGVNNTFEMKLPLYSYSNDWEFDASRESIVTLEIDWRNNTSGNTQTYYYRIPFNYLKAQGDTDSHKFRLRRNYIYQFMVDVSVLGGPNPYDAVDLYANFDVIDWTEHTIAVSVFEYHYLTVYERKVEMSNIAYREVEYKSSAPVAFQNITARCSYYTSTGLITDKIYQLGDQEFPRITDRGRKSDGKTYIGIATPVPINYVPRSIGFRVVHTIANLYSDVEVIQYPKRFVTASPSSPKPTAGAWVDPNGTIPTSGTSISENSYSTNSPWGSPSSTPPQINFNLFKITTLALDSEDLSNDYILGDPTTRLAENPLPNYSGVYYQTQTTESAQNIVSPAFVIASQRGITYTHTSWSTAQDRCAAYREDKYGSGTWRVPTRAELMIISKMQADPNSAIRELFQSTSTSGWWTSKQYDRVNVATGEVLTSTSSSAKAAVRCVHDTWRYND